MIVDENSYVAIRDNTKEYSKELVEVEELESFGQHIDAKLLDFSPSLMIYGTYNAGKSTLLNALFGQDEMAKTGDTPETKDVKSYKYNGYTIYDTPGLNAKGEDDMTTSEHLDKSEVVLFVMSNNGSLEEDYVYTKIVEVIKANKPIIIVLNNKTGIDINSVEAQESIMKIEENLRKIGDRNSVENIENKVSLCMVNAKTALKGKLENKNLILKKSNIMQLENMIEKLLHKSGSKEVINALNKYIQTYIDSVIYKIDNKIDDKQTAKIEEQITYLEKFKQNSQVKLKNTVAKRIQIFIDEFTSISLTADQTAATEYIHRTIEETTQHLNDMIGNINSELSANIDNFSNELNTIISNYKDTYVPTSDDEQIESTAYLSDDIKKTINITLKNKEIVKGGAKQALTLAKQWLPKAVMHGKGEKWIAGVASKAAVGVTVAYAAYEMYDANQEHLQMIKKEKNHTLQAKNNAEIAGNNLLQSMSDNIDETIDSIFNTQIIELKKISRSLIQDNSGLIEKKEKLQSISNKL